METYKFLCYVLLMLLNMQKEYNCYPFSGLFGCRDVYILISGDIINCDHLLYPSRHGLHLNPKFYCTEYSATRCCMTCTFLERHKYRVINGFYSTRTAASLPETTELYNYGLFNEYKKTTNKIPASSIEKHYQVFENMKKESTNSVQTAFGSNDYKVFNDIQGVTTTELPVAVESLNYKTKKDVYRTTTTHTPAYTAENYISSLYETTQEKKALITFFTVPSSSFKKQMITTDIPFTTPTQPLIHDLITGGVHITDVPLPTTKLQSLQNITQTVQPSQNTGRTVERFFTIPPSIRRIEEIKPNELSAKHSASTQEISEKILYENIPLVEPAPLLVINMSSTYDTIPLEPASIPSKSTTDYRMIPRIESIASNLVSNNDTISIYSAAAELTNSATYYNTTTTKTTTTEATTERQSTMSHETNATEAATTLTKTTVPPEKYPPMTTTAQNTTTLKEMCIDVGIWVVNASVSCDHLVNDNKYGLNRNQMYFCNRYPLTSCCETCGRINREFGLYDPSLTLIREVQQQLTTTETPLSTVDTRIAESDKIVGKRTVPTKSPWLQDPRTKNQTKMTETPVIGTQTTLSPKQKYKIKQTTHIQTEPTVTTQMRILPNITQKNQPRKIIYQNSETLFPVIPAKTPAEIVDTHAITGQTEKQQNTNATEQRPLPESHYVVSKIETTTSLLGTSKLSTITSLPGTSKLSTTTSLQGTSKLSTTTSLPGTSKLSTIKTTMKQTTTIQTGLAGKRCVDIGIWIGSGSVSCDFLYLDNKHKINEDPLYFCNRYPLTSCCNTCAMINSMLGH